MKSWVAQVHVSGEDGVSRALQRSSFPGGGGATVFEFVFRANGSDGWSLGSPGPGPILALWFFVPGLCLLGP